MGRLHSGWRAFSRRRGLLVATLHFALLGTTSVSSPASAADPDPDLAGIISHLDEWRISFASLRAVYPIWNRYDLEQRFAEVKELDTLDGHFYRRQAFLWTETGVIRAEFESCDRGALISRSLHGTDGRRSYRAVSDRNRPKDRWATIELAGPSQVQHVGPAALPLFALWWNHGQCIVDVLADPANTTALLGFEELDGRRSAHVTVRRKGAALPHHLWLDPEHDFLPWQAATDPPKN